MQNGQYIEEIGTRPSKDYHRNLFLPGAGAAAAGAGAAGAAAGAADFIFVT